MGWGDETLAAWLGITSPSATTSFDFGLPFILAAATLISYHAIHSHIHPTAVKPPKKKRVTYTLRELKERQNGVANILRCLEGPISDLVDQELLKTVAADTTQPQVVAANLQAFRANLTHELQHLSDVARSYSHAFIKDGEPEFHSTYKYDPGDWENKEIIDAIDRFLPEIQGWPTPSPRERHARWRTMALRPSQQMKDWTQQLDGFSRWVYARKSIISGLKIRYERAYVDGA